MSGTFVGVRPLLHASLRQDRRRIAPWIALITALSVSSVLAYPWVFPDEASRAGLAMTVEGNPAFSLIFGPARELTTADGFNAWRAGALGAFFAGLMAIGIVVRNSRAHEDNGQAELIASGVVGRDARLAVAVAMAAIASVLLGVVVSVATIAFGGEAGDSITLAATFTASGLMFAGIAAVTAQIGSEARAASSLAVTALGVAFVARGYIDTSGAADWLIWLTPLGWLEQVRVADGNDWRPLLACLGLAVAAVAVAGLLQSRRDLGMGLLPPRPGPDRGRGILNPWGLALRLQRGAIVSWTIALAVLGVVFGFLSTTVGELFLQNPAFAEAIASGGASTSGLVFEFLVTIIRLVGLIAAVYGVQVMMRLHAEEDEFRVDPLLAGAVPRTRLLASHAVLALVGPALALLISGGVVGLTAQAQSGDIAALDVLRQAAVTIPAVWVLVGIALATVGAAPAVRAVAWFAIVLSFALTILGPL
ncbi:ABC transporter permease, partial [Actinotalea sp.]|uniref:ABC transporter permease n=1 Tax=Actinotalea sp. TaxID=1872145 RepID=UPI003569F1D7